MNNDTNTTNNFAELPEGVTEHRYMTVAREAGILPTERPARRPRRSPFQQRMDARIARIEREQREQQFAELPADLAEHSYKTVLRNHR